MRHFIGVVHHEKGSGWGIHFPDVPGCFSAADTLDELPAKASEALSFWFEDQPMIEPRALELIQKDLGCIDYLTSGAFLMAIPLVALTGRTVKANLTMDAGLLQAIDAAAKARGMTRSAFLADIARREIAA